MSRINTLKDDHPAVKSLSTLAPEHCADIVSAFHLSGMFLSGANGAIPLSWSELKAFNESAMLELDSWSFRVLRAMSERYCSMSFNASRNDIPPPHVQDYEEYKRYQLAESEKNMRAWRNSRKAT